MNRPAERFGFEAEAGAKRRSEPWIEAPHRAYAASLLLAIGIHATILFWWPKDLLFQPAEYGVVRGESAMEVTLVAALPSLEDEPIESQAPPVEPQETTPAKEAVGPHESIAETEYAPLTPVPPPATDPGQERKQPEQIPDAKPRPTATGVAPATPSRQRKAARVAPSDDSSGGRNRSGNNSSTASLTSGSLTAKAAYLFNPHPPYPEQSRSAGHTGLVILRVSINEHGRVAAVRIVKSSGYALLDHRARTTLQRWVFKPARQAGRPVATQVDVPIRFSLDR